MYCAKCGNEIVDGAAFCPNCGAPVEQNNANTNTNNYTYYDPNVQNNVYNPVQQQYQPNYEAQFMAQKELSTARTLGIVSIILGILGINLFGWICGGIGLSKANRYLNINDMQIQHSAQEAKKLNVIGLVVTSIVVFVYIIFAILSVIGSAAFLSYM